MGVGSLKAMHRILLDSGEVKKTEFSLAVRSLDIGEKKARKLIERGDGRFWNIKSGDQKNAQLVTPIQFGSSATPIETAKLPNKKTCQNSQNNMQKHGK